MDIKAITMDQIEKMALEHNVFIKKRNWFEIISQYIDIAIFLLCVIVVWYEGFAWLYFLVLMSAVNMFLTHHKTAKITNFEINPNYKRMED